MPSPFSTRLLAWWRRHGRRDLPWQQRPTPYRVWVSEIMLQQTQVATVIPYYQRFMRRFAGVRALAVAPLDDVLGHWSGLGYYARARNMHRAAGVVLDTHGGRFPRQLDAVMALPGIGRSTAGAILSLALGQRQPILDGNVKRVLARHGGIAGWPGATAVSRALWALAEAHLPGTEPGPYNQALMDLGATLCTARNPDCGRCPVAADCIARREQRTAELPGSKPRRTIPERSSIFLIARNPRGRVLLERRPPSGVWGGLWCPPHCGEPDEVSGRLERLGVRQAGEIHELDALLHTFSHFRLRIAPLLVPVEEAAETAADAPALRWAGAGDLPALGLAAPVARLVASVINEEAEEDR